jgi:hypothetical protein
LVPSQVKFCTIGGITIFHLERHNILSRTTMALPTVIHPKNVRCSKDKRVGDEEGNILFKAIVLENVDRYNSEFDKVRKMRLTAEILEEFKRRSDGGAFYKYDSREMKWVLCDDSAARDKISHALRFQIKRRGRRPRLQRAVSVPRPISSAIEMKQKRKRSGSFDSCPAKIESIAISNEFISEDSQCGYSHDDLDESVLTDPLTFFNEMVVSGELDHFHSIDCSFIMELNAATQADYILHEVSPKSDENVEYSDSDENLGLDWSKL